MRFMVMVKATKESEAGVLPDEKLLTEMGKFNEELVKAGVMLAGEGLQASAKGARVKFSGAKRTVTDGPFPETKELVAGFWLWQVKSKEEAIEFYRSTLDAEVIMLMRYKECPEPHQPGMIPPGAENKIMHATLRIGATTVMASDGHCAGKPSFQGFSLSLSVADAATADRI